MTPLPLGLGLGRGLARSPGIAIAAAAENEESGELVLVEKPDRRCWLVPCRVLDP